MYIQIKFFPVLENYMLPAGSFLWELVLLPIDTINHFPHLQPHPTSKYCNEECLRCFLPSKRHFLDPSEGINSLTFHINRHCKKKCHLWEKSCECLNVQYPMSCYFPPSQPTPSGLKHFSSNNSEILAKNIPDERLISRIYKEYLQLNTKKTSKK